MAVSLPLDDRAVRGPEPDRTKYGKHPWSLVALLLGFLASAALYSVVVPIWEAPDEPEHFQYVRFLIEQHTLPSHLPTIQPDGNQEGKQPPLYYLLAVPFAAGVDLGDANRIRLNPHLGWPHDPAIAAHVLDECWPYHGAVLAAHRVRLLSVLLGGLTVAFTYGIATTALQSRRLGLLAAALVALLPGFLFASATFDNDMLVNVLSAALLLLVLQPRRGPAWRPALAFGLVGCLALLAKLDAAVPVGVGLLVLLARAHRAQRGLVLLASIAPLLPALLYWGWHVTRGSRELISANVGWPPPLPGASGPLDWAAALHFGTVLWTTFVGAFGWPNVWLPPWAYALYGVVIVGGLLSALPSCRREDQGPNRGDLLVLLAWLGAVLAAVLCQPFLVRGDFSAYGHSRYLYPALPAMATLLAYGCSRATATRPTLRPLLGSCLVLATAGAWAIPWLVIRPAYPPPYPVEDHLPREAALVTGASFGQRVVLAGVGLPRNLVGAGEGVVVTFYWRVQQPLPDGTWLFVHVEDQRGHAAAAFDGPPLYGQFPLSFWRLGDVVLDRELLTVHQDASSGTYLVKVGWYGPKTGQRVPLTAGGNEFVAGAMQIEGKRTAACTACRLPGAIVFEPSGV